jgi:hypothetical protein
MGRFLRRVLGAVRLDAATYEEVEADETALGQAMAVVVASSVAAGVGHLGAGPGALVALVFGTLLALVGWFAWAGITWVVGTRLLPEPQTEADLGQLLRAVGFSSAPGLLRALAGLAIVGPWIGWLASIWMLVAMVVAVRQALDYEGIGRAIAVCLIGWVVYVLLSVGFLFAAFGAGAVANQLG